MELWKINIIIISRIDSRSPKTINETSTELICVQTKNPT